MIICFWRFADLLANSASSPVCQYLDIGWVRGEQPHVILHLYSRFAFVLAKGFAFEFMLIFLAPVRKR
jgi:hypothetical protein